MLCVYLFIFTAVSLSLSAAAIPGVERPPADCERPKNFPEWKSKSLVEKINLRRWLMVQGKQKNGPLESYLPVGENVVEMLSTNLPSQTSEERKLSQKYSSEETF
ncbi:hypothetical protein Y032_0030g2168 [Ancylostoma ceylanicum]|uniref:Uncharacterized protein n=1 Tax=Ancylostoma ceylanicum TaxID=53326 RepID=A0A016US32_9BILA|nr:hypothetical protein Y032_0030g2168 [Ancylostoma ceylanicum]